MRILVVTSSPPNVEGGHLVIARELVRACRAEGHTADLVVTPQNRFGRQGAAYLAAWLTDVGVDAAGAPVDRVISLRYPAFAVRHPHHIGWLTHTMREYYDLWPRFSATLGWPNRVKETVRRALVHAADRRCFARMQARYTISATVQARLAAVGVQSEVLLPPPPARTYRTVDYGDFVFTASRLTPLKRVDLLLSGLALPTARHVKAVIAGEGEAEGALQAQVRRLGIGDRVTFVGRISDDALVDYYARCRAVAFVPFDEDYGFVTAEAFASGKAVMTCRDSGGPTELVRDGESGLVVEPTAEAVAHALAALTADRTRAEVMGGRGRAQMASLSWPTTVARLLDGPPTSAG